MHAAGQPQEVSHFVHPELHVWHSVDHVDTCICPFHWSLHQCGWDRRVLAHGGCSTHRSTHLPALPLASPPPPPPASMQLRYLVQSPPPGSEDPKARFKYPFAACEIFCCEVEGIFNTLLEDDDLLALLFSILQVRM